MKRKLLLGFWLLLTSVSYAQFTTIPDDNFEQALIDQGYDNILDNQVLTANIDTITFLNLTGVPGTVPETDPNLIGLDIEDLTGIEGFTNLQTLFIQGNNLTTVDLSNNLELIDVRAFRNNVLQSINITGLTKLEIIGLNNNQISNIDVSTNTNLIIFDIANNDLNSLDISSLNAITRMDVRGNSSLICIQVENATIANNFNADSSNFRRNSATQFSDNCNSIYTVEVTVISGQEIDANNNFILTEIGGNNSIELGFDLKDENGNELPASTLNSYNLIINTTENNAINPATKGVDFESITNEQLQINTVDSGSDGSRTVATIGDGIFEADEFFLVEISTNDPNITLMNAVNGIVQIPVKIIDNQVTNVNLEVVDLGAEPNQNARLRITSSLQNNTGAPLPFDIALGGGAAVIGEDYQDLVNQPSIADGESSVEFDVIILNNDDEVEGLENFFTTISYAGNLNDENERVVIQNGSEEISISDDGDVNQNSFTVSPSIGGDVVNLSSENCCPDYEIEEGQLLEFNFNADANAPLGEEYIVQVNLSGTAGNADISFREFDPNLQFTYTVKTTSPDNTLQIDVLNDGIAEANGEILNVTLTAIGNNYSFSGTTFYQIRILDQETQTQPFQVTADIVGAEGNTPNYTIEEGQSFDLTFNADANATIGATYVPIITVTQNGIESTEDFSVGDLDQLFTVSTANPDGSITFMVNDDGITEGEETYTIRLSSPESNFIWQNANADGSLEFEIKIIDVPAQVNIIEISAEGLNNLPPSSEFSTIEQFTVHEDQEEILLSFDLIEGTDLTDYEITLRTDGGQAVENQDFEPVNIMDLVSVVPNTNDSSYTIKILNDNLNETSNFGPGEQFAIEISTTTENTIFKTIQGNMVSSYDMSIFIIDDDNNSDPFLIETSLSENVTEQNGVFSIQEGETLGLSFNALNPAAENFIYSVNIDVEGSTATLNNDFTLPQNLPFEVVVKDGINPDGGINFEIISDIIEETEELLIINLRPDPNGIFGWQGADDNGVLQIPISIVDNNEVSDLIEVNIENSGGIEGGTDIITVSLKDIEGNEFINDTDNPITFNLQFRNEIDINAAPTGEERTSKYEDGVPANELHYRALGTNEPLETTTISVLPGSSTGTLEVEYLIDDNEDREFYTVAISAITNPEQFTFSEPKIQVIILDNEGPFYIAIFPDPEGALTILPDGGDFSQSCCTAYSIEENNTLRLLLDVEKGVPATESNTPDFTIPFFLGGNATLNVDYINTNSDTTLEIEVEPEEDSDNQLILNILPDDEPNERGETLIGETLAIFFENPISGNYTNELKFDRNLSLIIPPINSYDIRIVDVIGLASLENISDTALEQNQIPAEIQVILESENVSGDDIFINYEIVTSANNAANPLNDYLIDGLNLTTNRGILTIPNGEATGLLTVVPIDDDRFEMDETVTINILPGAGYSLGAPGNSFSTQITIESDDLAEFSVGLEGQDLETRENDENDFAKVIVRRTEETNAAIEDSLMVNFSVISSTGNPEEDSDYVVFGPDQETRILGTLKTVTIPANMEEVSIYIKAIDDTVEENIERVEIRLQDGVNYLIDSDTSSVIVDLISDEVPSTFDPSTISVTVQNPICAGNDQLGSILIENGSGFEFYVEVVETDTDEIIDDGREILMPLFSDTPEISFKGVPIGQYDIRLEVTENNEIVGTFSIPSFRVTINAVSTILANQESIDLNENVLNLSVEGSDFYRVNNNGTEIRFNTQNTANTTLKIPLFKGRNDIIVTAGAECLGKIERTIFFNQIIAYPNPTDGLVLFEGLMHNMEYQFLLTDSNGKQIRNERVRSIDGTHSIDITNHLDGIYHVIFTTKRQVSNFKIIKR